LHRDAKALAWRLLELGPWNGMVAVTRGGLAPAAIVARALDIRFIETVCVIGYGPDDYNPQQANLTTVIKPPAVVGDGGGWLVVDDLVDTGRNAKVLRKLMPKAHFAHLREAPRPGAGRYLRHRGHLNLFPLGKRSDGVNDHAAHRRLNTAIPAIVRLYLCRRHFPRNLSLEETRTDRLIV
jgi:hypothetical protein